MLIEPALVFGKTQAFVLNLFRKDGMAAGAGLGGILTGIGTETGIGTAHAIGNITGLGTEIGTFYGASGLILIPQVPPS